MGAINILHYDLVELSLRAPSATLFGGYRGEAISALENQRGLRSLLMSLRSIYVASTSNLDAPHFRARLGGTLSADSSRQRGISFPSLLRLRLATAYGRHVTWRPRNDGVLSGGSLCVKQLLLRAILIVSLFFLNLPGHRHEKAAAFLFFDNFPFFLFKHGQHLHLAFFAERNDDFSSFGELVL